MRMLRIHKEWGKTPLKCSYELETSVLCTLYHLFIPLTLCGVDYVIPILQTRGLQFTDVKFLIHGKYYSIIELRFDFLVCWTPKPMFLNYCLVVLRIAARAFCREILLIHLSIIYTSFHKSKVAFWEILYELSLKRHVCANQKGNTRKVFFSFYLSLSFFFF
jgi:hypothetical protein